MRAYETAQNYANAFIRSDIRRMSWNNSRYLEYCELRRTCLRRQNNMQERVVYFLPFLPLIVAGSYFYCTTIVAHAYFVELENYSGLSHDFCDSHDIAWKAFFFFELFGFHVIQINGFSFLNLIHHSTTCCRTMPSAKWKCELGYISVRYETKGYRTKFHIRRYLISLNANVSGISAE